MRSVTARVVNRIAVVVEKIPAIDVIHKSVCVVIDTVSGDLAGIDPSVCRKILMRIEHARVDVRDHHARAARRQIPCGRSRDLSQAVHSARSKHRVVGRHKQMVIKIWLCVLDVTKFGIPSDRLIDIQTIRQPDPHPAQIAKLLDHVGTDQPICRDRRN